HPLPGENCGSGGLVQAGREGRCSPARWEEMLSVALKIRNPNVEIRNKHEIRKSRRRSPLAFQTLRVSDFVFRISAALAAAFVSKRPVASMLPSRSAGPQDRSRLAAANPRCRPIHQWISR